MTKLTSSKLREHTNALLESINNEMKASTARGENFASHAPADIEKNIGESETPFLSMVAWSKKTPPGGRVDLSVFVWNSVTSPTPDLYVHVWVGSGNIDPEIGTFLMNVDSGFPRLTRPEHPGLIDGDPHPLPLSPGLKRLNFSLAVPLTMDASVYLGNICLMQLASHKVGKYLGRGAFPFLVEAPK